MFNLNQFPIFITIFLLFAGCSHTVQNDSAHHGISIKSNNKKLSSQLIKDLIRLEQNDTKQYHQQIFVELEQINISPNNCSGKQIACVFPTYKGVIFLKPEYFDLPWHERIGTLLHEQKHHQLNSYQHVSCSSPLIDNKDCDEDDKGSFGAELNLYLYLLQLPNITPKQKTKLKRSVKETVIRINGKNIYK